VTSQHLSFSRRIFTARMRFQSVRHERWPADAKWISDIASNTIETRISTVFTVAPAVSSAVPGYPAASSSSLICSRPNYMMGFPPSVAKKSRALDSRNSASSVRISHPSWCCHDGLVLREIKSFTGLWGSGFPPLSTDISPNEWQTQTDMTRYKYASDELHGITVLLFSGHFMFVWEPVW